MERGNARIIGLLVAGLVLLGLLFWFIQPGDEADVVLYCGVDQDQSRPMVDVFQQGSGLSVRYQGETEAQRSIGLPPRIREEKANPRGDVYWSNEIMQMASLADEGLIDKLPEGLAETFPAAWRDKHGHFIQFGARARVLLVNTELLPDPATWPKSVHDLYDPKWKDMGFQTAMSAPLTGTTLTHAVAWLTKDEAAAKDFYEKCSKAMKKGILKVVASNGRVMKAVRDKKNKIAFGLTDTDDSHIARLDGAPVAVIYPDQGEGQMGTVLLPNTAALLKGRPHDNENAVKLLRWLASPETERKLAEGPAAQIPVRPDITDLPEHIKRPGVDFRATEFDWYAVARNKDRWSDLLTGMFRAVD